MFELFKDYQMQSSMVYVEIILTLTPGSIRMVIEIRE
jgi:hypothetical protein